MKFARNCPMCGKEIVYKTEKNLWLSVRRKALCRHCSSSGKNNGMFGKTRPEMVGDKNPAKSHDVRQKLRDNNSMKRPEIVDKLRGDNNPAKRPEVREKLRQAFIQQVKNSNGIWCPPSKSCTKFLDEVEKLYGITIEREQVIGARFFDGKYKNNLIEIDCKYWPAVDILKNQIAINNGFILHRFDVPSVSKVSKKLVEYKESLDTIFGPV